MSSLPGLPGPTSPALQLAPSGHLRGRRGSNQPAEELPLITDRPTAPSFREEPADEVDLASPVKVSKTTAMQPAEELPVRQLKAGDRILRIPKVEQRLGLKRSSIYARLSPGSKQFDREFPKPISLTAKNGAICRRRAAVGWIESEIDAYLALLSLERDSK